LVHKTLLRVFLWIILRICVSCLPDYQNLGDEDKFKISSSVTALRNSS